MRYPLRLTLVLVLSVLLIAGLVFAVYSPRIAHGKTVKASMYGGPTDPGCSTALAAPRAGRLKKGRNIIALRTHKFGQLYIIKYRRHHRTYQQLACNLDYGPARWTGKYVDLGYGLAGRLAFNGAHKVQIVRVGKLPKRLWRKFKSYRDLRECRRKLHF